MTTEPSFKDHFSSQAAAYRSYRPDYPPLLFAWLAAQCPRHQAAWDCGCGNGQAALGLTPHFATVYASDPSTAQVAEAIPHPAVHYSVASAEDSHLPAAAIDLVVVAQALHWFDFERFYAEVRRVTRPGGVLAAFSYGEVQLGPAFDPIIDHFYHDVVGPYWPPERRHVDAGYRSIPFPFAEITAPFLELQADWDLDHLLGYLGTWSALRGFRRATGDDPLPNLRQSLVQQWGDPAQCRPVRWPLALRVGRVGGEP
ncbi:class I SAM-dependent methyltransferase [Desulfuromonas carbonis]|uniref:class I SAM-dependent methyltransferase n=1 Tax=Desulfuromonas sp. DDH964 TaxID=1823759 RepID=UPI00078B9F9D|nr:class I SAM-dependent methyltransferase [Desulfuromonas sp. DDH964]AMV71616.1 SAM-dependent methyltransferase [Desulfuromonas sp. DDH964]